MGFIIETPLSPHMAGRPTRLIARDVFLLDTASRASRCKARRQNPCLVAWNKHGHLEQARTDLCPACSVKDSHLDQTRSDLCPASSVSVRCVVVLFPRAKVPPLEQKWTPRTSTDRSVPCQFSQSRPLRTNANRSVPRRLYQGWPPRTTSIRLRPACSVKVDTV